MGKSIIVTSAKGGVGKTNTIVNLGIALTDLGKSVVLVDGSLTTPDLSLHLGIPFHVRGLVNLLKENAHLESAVFHHKSGMKVIPGNVHINVLKEFEGKQFGKLLKKLKSEHDFVLVDCAAGLGREAVSAIKQCDKMLVVTNPELASAVNSSKAIQLAKQMKVKPIGVIINRKGRFREELKEEDLTPLFHNVKILGTVWEDSRVPKSIKKSEAIIQYYPNCRVSREFYDIAESMLPKSRTVERPGFLTRLLDAFKK
jgi:septum site-determining protein MinD